MSVEDRPAEATPDVEANSSDVIRLVEEVASIGVRRVDRGGVRVSTATETVTETFPVRLTDEAVSVERVPVGAVVSDATAARMYVDGDDEVTVVPVYAERAVVVTELYLVEEVRIRRRRTVREDSVSVDLRRQTAAIEDLSPLPSQE